MGKFIDLTDKRFGKLTVLARGDKDRHGNMRWYCHCDCGNFTTVLGGSLKSGASQSCGCGHKGGSEPIGLLGKRYGKLVVLAEAGRSRWGEVVWHCLCDCGQFHIVDGRHLRKGATKSCGCSRRLPLGIAAKNTLLKKYKQGAESRGLVWELTDEEFYGLTQQRCHYCGMPPVKLVYGNHYGNYPHNGVDRKDNSRGYIGENVVPCCTTCNFRKLNVSYAKFVAWLDRVATFRFSKEKGAKQ